MKRRKSQARVELPFREIAQFWNWLPAFRAVAEAGGVNEAARLLRVSPSSLSRSVGLLEAALGRQLFFREGSITLTPEGERLLSTTRDAMRQVHEAVQSEGAALETVRLGATSRLGFYRLLSTLRVLRERSPETAVRTATVRDDDIARLLLRGELDLVVAAGAGAPRGVAATPLRPAAYHVYCGRRHPLYERARLTDEAVAEHGFAAPAAAAAAASTDAWPAERPRRVDLVCDTLEPAIDACVRGELLACFPDEVVAALGLDAKLRALPHPVLPAAPLQCIHRAPVGQSASRVNDIIATMQ